MYTVFANDHYEGEMEVVFEDLSSAIEFAGKIIDDGGDAEVCDGSYNTVWSN